MLHSLLSDYFLLLFSHRWKKTNCSSPAKHFYMPWRHPFLQNPFLLPGGLSLGAVANRPPLSLFNYLIPLTCIHTQMWMHTHNRAHTWHHCSDNYRRGGTGTHTFSCTHFLSENKKARKGGRVCGDNIVLAFFGPCDESACYVPISALCARVPKSQDVGFVCVSSTAEGQMPYYKAKRKRSAKGEVSVVKLTLNLTVTFNNMSNFLWVSFACLCVCFLKLLGLIIKSRQTIKARHPL